VNRIDAYQAAAERCGTVIERAEARVAPRLGGGITKHPLARSVADALIRDLKALGAEAKIYDPRYARDDRVFVYLSGCSFQKGDLS
jgi:predicted nucleic acid-binding Zn ribbon protein